MGWRYGGFAPQDGGVGWRDGGAAPQDGDVGRHDERAAQQDRVVGPQACGAPWVAPWATLTVAS